MTIEESLQKIKETTLKERRLLNELNSLFNHLSASTNKNEEMMLTNQIQNLKYLLKGANDILLTNLEKINLSTPLKSVEPQKIAPEKIVPEKSNPVKKKSFSLPFTLPMGSKSKFTGLEKEVVERIKKKKETPTEKKEKKSRFYTDFATRLFSERVKIWVKQKKFKSLTEDLVKSNLEYTSITYLSMLCLNTIVSIIGAFVLFLFFLFFNLNAELPIVTLATGGFWIRLLKTFWILLVIPGSIFLFSYFLPSLEKKSIETKINTEIPFATIHMAAISGSMIDPIKIFTIICSTQEYPYLEKEFNKLLNEINVYGYDFVTALKDLAANTPSQKLAELFNGLVTTITSGGDLYTFFEKRSQTMMFDYKLERERSTKTAETFMDMYISIVIAAPMVLMLLLMMMKISGIGIKLPTNIITLLVVGAVSLVNIFFLIFLQIKQANSGGAS